jgi:hypothetical protein
LRSGVLRIWTTKSLRLEFLHSARRHQAVWWRQSFQEEFAVRLINNTWVERVTPRTANRASRSIIKYNNSDT